MKPGSPIFGLRPRCGARLQIANFPNPDDAHGLGSRGGVAYGEEIGRDRVLGNVPARGKIGGDVRDKVVLVHLVSLLNCKRNGRRRELRENVPSR